MRRGRRRREDNPAQLRFALSGASPPNNGDAEVPPRSTALAECRRKPAEGDRHGDSTGRAHRT